MKVVILTLLFAISIAGQVNTISVATDDTPSPRNQPAIAFDSGRNRLVLFGGIAQNGEFLNDTWEWDGAKWEKKTLLTQPSIRAVHAITYDSKRKRVVLFGGQTGQNSLSDTWEWDGKTWHQIQTATTPPARVAHALVFDKKKERVVLFGGTDFGTMHTFNDTWEYNGKNWAQIKTPLAPEGRFHHSMAYDTKRQRIVLFGGNAAIPPLNSEKFKAGQRNDVWEFDGRLWNKIKTFESPSKRDHFAMAYDQQTNQTILFGGYSGTFEDGVYLGDTWIWNGKVWKKIDVEKSPSARGGKPAMTYDTKSKRVILFGGGTPQKAMNDMWFLIDGQWIENKYLRVTQIYF